MFYFRTLECANGYNLTRAAVTFIIVVVGAIVVVMPSLIEWGHFFPAMQPTTVALPAINYVDNPLPYLSYYYRPRLDRVLFSCQQDVAIEDLDCGWLLGGWSDG